MDSPHDNSKLIDDALVRFTAGERPRAFMRPQRGRGAFGLQTGRPPGFFTDNPTKSGTEEHVVF